jgi:formylglycine-generating enzyme required for sulfatase activity
MKNILSLLILLSINSIVFAQKPETKNTTTRFISNPRGFVYIPTGMFTDSSNNHMRISAFYLSASEVTNKQYNEFLNDLKDQGRDADYELAKPQNQKWKNFDAQMIETYQKKEEMPVVNISKQAALLYCQWLTEKENGKNREEIVQYRLASKAEWQYAAGSITSVGKRDMAKGIYSSKKILVGNRTEPNKYGLYFMCGNVAEMVVDENIAIGGNWQNDVKDLSIYNTIENAASPIVGFRVLMTYVGKVK